MTNAKGFSEAALPYDAALSVQTTLGPDGRVLIPAALRDAAGIKRGDKLTLRMQDGRIVVTSFKAELKRLQGALAHLKKPGVSIVDEFLAERRAMWGEDE